MLPRKTPQVPGRKNVTICIAAACNTNFGPTIIFCADSMVSSPFGTANTKLKVLPLTEGWVMGVSGRDDEINAMFRLMREAFLTAKLQGAEIDDRNANSLVRAALAIRSADKKNEMAHAQLGMSFQDVLDIGNKKLPPDQYDNFIAEARAIKFDGEFIVAGIADGAPLMIATTVDGTTAILDHYIAVGSGAYLAQATMLMREHWDIHPFGQSLYTVFEAKRAAERESGVGKETWIYVLDKTGLRPLSDSGWNWLKEQYKKVGPQPLPPEMDAPDDALDEHFIVPRGASSFSQDDE